MRKPLARGLCAATAFCGLLLASQARAAGTQMPWEGPLQQVVDSITGPVAQAAAVKNQGGRADMVAGMAKMFAGEVC